MHVIVWSESKTSRPCRTFTSFCVVAGDAPCLKSVPCVILQAESGTHRAGGTTGLRADVLVATGSLALWGENDIGSKKSLYQKPPHLPRV